MDKSTRDASDARPRHPHLRSLELIYSSWSQRSWPWRRREEAEQVIEEAEVRADALRAEVAEAERRRDAAVAEANRRLAERHATNTVAGG